MNYTTLNPTYTFNALLDAFRTVIEKLQAIRDKLPLPDNDARQVALFGMQEVILAFGLTVHAISGNGLRSRERGSAEVLESFENYGTVRGKNGDQLRTSMEGMWRLSMLSLFHFKMDSLFQNILMAMAMPPGKTGFGRNMAQLTSLITLPSSQGIQDVLNASTLVRNSIHNNGIHRGSDWGPVTLHGFVFEFRKDQPVRCASFGHVLAVLDSTADALEQILLSPEVVALATVEDRYTKLNP